MNKNFKEAILLFKLNHSKNIHTNCIFTAYVIANVGNQKVTIGLIAIQNYFDNYLNAICWRLQFASVRDKNCA